MAVVTGDAGREAADIIQNAQQRQIPMLTVREAARRAGISPEGWNKVVKNGRGRLETVMAMARAVSVEDDVRRVLGMPPLRKAAQAAAGGGSAVTILEGALSAGERFIMNSDLDPEFAAEMVKAWREVGLGDLIAAVAAMQRKQRNG